MSLTSSTSCSLWMEPLSNDCTFFIYWWISSPHARIVLLFWTMCCQYVSLHLLIRVLRNFNKKLWNFLSSDLLNVSFRVVLSNVFYYSLYALMLYKTMQNDINYWRSAGSLLNSFASLDFAKIETVVIFFHQNPTNSDDLWLIFFFFLIFLSDFIVEEKRIQKSSSSRCCFYSLGRIEIETFYWCWILCRSFGRSFS